MKQVRIGKRVMGNKQLTYFVAEIGGNFSTYNTGMKLINTAIGSGADAVKIQTFTAKNTVSKYATFDLPAVGGKKTQFEVLHALELDRKIQKKLFDYCKKKNITIFSSPSHKSDVDFLEENNIGAYKVGSDDLTNLPLIRQIGRLLKPTIISTGMSNLKDVKEAVKAFYSTGNDKLILLHCVSFYPLDPKYANLEAIITMRDTFGIPVGWSDHTKGIEVCIAAATLGANLIEKHFTLNKKAKGPDHIISATPNELSRMISTIRMIEKAKGTGVKKPAKCEIRSVIDIRKSVVAAKKILKGSIITKDLLEIKRPATGLPPAKIETIIGKRAAKDIEQDKPIQMQDLM
ncbi:MAG: N-acetylneuraminate synthase family protein [Candidatus Paceibacterota bacterium]